MLYLNSAHLSLLPLPIQKSIEMHRQTFEQNPAIGLRDVWEMLWGVHKMIDRFFDCDPQGIVLRTNITEAMNLFVLGLPLPKGGEILTSDMEYSAIENICRLKAQREHLVLRKFQLPKTPLALKNCKKKHLIDAFLSQLTPQTRLVVLSHVISGIGLVMPIYDIARETKKRRIFLAIDGAYAAGAIPVSIRKLDVDFYCTNFYKWMLGPKGTGFGWVSPRCRKLLVPIEAGIATYETPPLLRKLGDGKLGDGGRGFWGEGNFTARYSMVGIRDFAPFLALREVFQFWKRQGPSTIFETIKKLNDEMEKIGEHFGWTKIVPADPKLRGPMTAFDLSKHWQSYGEDFAVMVSKKLGLEIGTYRANGQWCLTFSPHIYNSRKDLQKAANILNSVLRPAPVRAVRKRKN